MNKEEQLDYLISELIKEDSQYSRIDIPADYQDKRKLLRALMNIHPPRPVSDEFLAVQDEFLSAEAAEKGIVDAITLPAVPGNPKLCGQPGTGANHDGIHVFYFIFKPF